MGPRRLWGPKMPEDGPTIAPDGTKMFQTGPKIGPLEGPRWSKIIQKVPKMAPNNPKITSRCAKEPWRPLEVQGHPQNHNEPWGLRNPREPQGAVDQEGGDWGTRDPKEPLGTP